MTRGCEFGVADNHPFNAAHREHRSTTSFQLVVIAESLNKSWYPFSSKPIEFLRSLTPLLRARALTNLLSRLEV